MTFNEGMQIDTSNTSTSGGGGGRGIAIGGGVGGLLVVVVALFLGVDPSTVLPQQGQATSQEAGGGSNYDLTKCKTGADANKYLECRIVATGNSVDGVWSQLLKGYRPPKMRLFSNSVHTACGPATTAVGPFYCPGDKTAYFDTTFFQTLVDQFGSSGGPLAQEYVVAHEYGHHVQDLLGDIGRAQQGPGGAEGNGVRTELQADCYAGVWAHYASTTKQEGTGVPFLQPLSDKDIADALSAASSVGDDRIQKEMQGRVNPESWTHGSSAERQKWFTIGYQTGDPKKCDTFNAASLG
ncbi:neutral zinc metallopeptidase [Mycobacterium sp. OTB74]|jgi:predicted metalloprotease|uniref:KPN_02809 family neutral zinc metallopeptidase n=1 Tax=Mycobacterium sp. OTB74 TaxID=1853452 RepID=UPI00247570CB|nr:neutral zinc metallopeptidase [Mycobacterium sp. OTB74]MDH6247013.1 putative metalloprotease [Mycobacterium sp. OTB74]